MTHDLFARLASRALATRPRDSTVAAVPTEGLGPFVPEPGEPSGEPTRDSPNTVVVERADPIAAARTEPARSAPPPVEQAAVQSAPGTDRAPTPERVVVGEHSALTERVVADRADVPPRIEPMVPMPPGAVHVERHHTARERKLITQAGVRPAPDPRVVPSPVPLAPRHVEAQPQPPTIEIRIDRLIVGTDDTSRPLAEPRREPHRRPAPESTPRLALAEYLANRGRT